MGSIYVDWLCKPLQYTQKKKKLIFVAICFSWKTAKLCSNTFHKYLLSSSLLMFQFRFVCFLFFSFSFLYFSIVFGSFVCFAFALF